MTITPKFRKKYAKRYAALLDQFPLRKQAFSQLFHEMKIEGVTVSESTVYRWIGKR